MYKPISYEPKGTSYMTRQLMLKLQRHALIRTKNTITNLALVYIRFWYESTDTMIRKTEFLIVCDKIEHEWHEWDCSRKFHRTLYTQIWSDVQFVNNSSD